MKTERYISVSYCRAWVMWDLDNGHAWNKQDSGKGYLWVFPTKKEALEHKRKYHKGSDKARLSKPIKIEYPRPK